jgi:hypothetical protein
LCNFGYWIHREKPFIIHTESEVGQIQPIRLACSDVVSCIKDTAHQTSDINDMEWKEVAAVCI